MYIWVSWILASERDCLKHYLLCKPLWDTICVVSSQPIPPSLPSISERLGLVAPSTAKALSLAVAYRAYHAMRNAHMQEVRAASVNLCFTPVLTTLKALVRHHWSEIN